jgi:hypothetical protein
MKKQTWRFDRIFRERIRWNVYHTLELEHSGVYIKINSNSNEISKACTRNN